jgi:hypothetical protein
MKMRKEEAGSKCVSKATRAITENQQKAWQIAIESGI